MSRNGIGMAACAGICEVGYQFDLTASIIDMALLAVEVHALVLEVLDAVSHMVESDSCAFQERPVREFRMSFFETVNVVDVTSLTLLVC